MLTSEALIDIAMVNLTVINTTMIHITMIKIAMKNITMINITKYANHNFIQTFSKHFNFQWQKKRHSLFISQSLSFLAIASDIQPDKSMTFLKRTNCLLKRYFISCIKNLHVTRILTGVNITILIFNGD